MSDKFDYSLLDNIMITDEEILDFSFLDNPGPIGQNEVNAYDYNAAYGFDPVFDFDFNAGFQPDPFLPGLPDATTSIGQSLPDYHQDLVTPTSYSPAPPINRDISEGSAEALSAQSPSHVESVEPKYIGWICQVCNESFTDHHDLNRHSYLWEHATWVCQVCNKSFTSYYLLRHHCRSQNHATWVCYHSDCDNRYFDVEHQQIHQQTHHLPGHHEVCDDSTLACAECGERVLDTTELQRHANARKHSSYTCLCGVRFARRDVLIRHIKGFDKKSATYPCTFCKSHRGKQAFRRRDHLVQHLRGYHKMEQEEINDISPPKTRLQSRQILICPYKDCEAYRDDAFKALPYETQFEARPFQKQTDYNKHMRDVHEDSLFSCSVANCDRVRAKGYMREKDLMKHMADKHPEAPSYVPSKPLKHLCGRCGSYFGAISSLIEHQSYAGCRNSRNETNIADPHD